MSELAKVPFYDHISIKQYSVPTDVRNKFFDSIMSSMDKQKDEKESDSITGLQITAKVTHAGRLTGHYHYYSPKMVAKGADTLLTPFKKPWLVNHDMDSDPIGRIQNAYYVSTPPAILPETFIDSINNISYHDKKTLSYLKRFKPFLYDNKFEGLGYVEVSANITDEEAIKKVLDGRYHTISVGYDTNSLHCSECFQDLKKDGLCEHTRGHDYGSGKMFYIFGDMTYRESSFVNAPADSLATIVEAKKITIPSLLELKDSISSIDNKIERAEMSMMAAAYDSMTVADPLRVLSTNISFYTTNDEDLQSLNNIGEPMGKRKLKKEADLYVKLCDFIPEENRLTEDQIAELADTDFVGANRMFPAHDLVHIEAAKSYLNTQEDSDEKTELISFLDERATKFNVAPATEDSTATAEPVVETQDEISYSFSLSAGSWGCPENKNTEYEKEILQLLLKIVSAEKEGAMDAINSVLSFMTDEDRVSAIAELSKDYVEDLSARVENYKNEAAVWKTEKDSLISAVTEAHSELKGFYADSLLSFMDKEDPNKTKEELVDSLKTQTLDQLKTSLENFKIILGKDNMLPPVVPQNILTHKDGEDSVEITAEDIAKLKANTQKTFQKLYRRDSAMANKFLVDQEDKISKLEKKINKNNNNNVD